MILVQLVLTRAMAKSFCRKDPFAEHEIVSCVSHRKRVDVVISSFVSPFFTKETLNLHCVLVRCVCVRVC